MPAPKITPVILTASPSARVLRDEIRRYAAVSATVLITGETGVGKDALARYLHAAGPRRDQPFITVDCPALPATLIEAELFGHERGAFTDATRARAGRFERAGGGTLYLDAVTSLSAAGQGALLRVVEDRIVTRIGGTALLPIRARIVASADTRVEALVTEGAFRAELFHRLRVLSVQIPPLRQRTGDVLPLARHFVADTCRALKRPIATIAPDCADALVHYPWPGNVRELRHVVERILLVGSGGDQIRARDLPLDLLDGGGERSLQPHPPTLSEVEHRYIVATLSRTRGNQTRAAAILGISRKSLWEKRRRFGLA